jgi:hypothetical protein
LNSNKLRLFELRILLYVLFAIPSYFVAASVGTWLVITIWALGLVAVLSMNYWPGYLAMLALLAGGAASNCSLILFAPAFCLALMFVTGTSALARHWEVAQQLILGTMENATELFSPAIRRFIRTFAAVTSIGLALSFAYSILPALVPTPTEPTTLAIYVAIALTALAIILRLASK